jgi:hypothetical protein
MRGCQGSFSTTCGPLEEVRPTFEFVTFAVTLGRRWYCRVGLRWKKVSSRVEKPAG